MYCYNLSYYYILVRLLENVLGGRGMGPPKSLSRYFTIAISLYAAGPILGIGLVFRGRKSNSTSSTKMSTASALNVGEIFENGICLLGADPPSLFQSEITFPLNENGRGIPRVNCIWSICTDQPDLLPQKISVNVPLKSGESICENGLCISPNVPVSLFPTNMSTMHSILTYWILSYRIKLAYFSALIYIVLVNYALGDSNIGGD